MTSSGQLKKIKSRLTISSDNVAASQQVHSTCFWPFEMHEKIRNLKEMIFLRATLSKHISTVGLRQEIEINEEQEIHTYLDRRSPFSVFRKHARAHKPPAGSTTPFLLPEHIPLVFVWLKLCRWLLHCNDTCNGSVNCKILHRNFR